MTIITEIELTHEEKLAQHVRSIIHESNALRNVIISMIKENFDRVWNSEFTPQEVIDALEAKGQSCLSLFAISAGLQNVVKLADSSYQKLVPSVPFTVVDGKIVVQNNE